MPCFAAMALMLRFKSMASSQAARALSRCLLADRTLLEPAVEGYFAGRFNRRGAALLLPSVIARFVPTLDFRNWEKIHSWAKNLYPQLVGSGTLRMIV